VSVIDVLATVARAEQVQPGDATAVAGAGVGLLLDGEPAGAEPLRPEPEPPAQAQAAANLASGGLDQLEVLGVAEPARELGGDRLGAVPLPEAPGQQRAEPGVGGERLTEPGEILGGEPLKERPGEGGLRHRNSCTVLRCCRRHGFRCTGKDSDLGIGEFPYMVIAWFGYVKLSAQPAPGIRMLGYGLLAA